MVNDLLFGIQTNGIKHTHEDPMPDIDTRFAMVRESGVFDYIDKTPAPDEFDQFLKARDKYGLPVRAGGWFYTLGEDEYLLEQNLQKGRDLGSIVHNTQIKIHHAKGHVVTDDEVVAAYLKAAELGENMAARHASKCTLTCGRKILSGFRGLVAASKAKVSNSISPSTTVTSFSRWTIPANR